MNYQLLQTFLILCETKNFSLAANRLFVTQSTITKRIAELEQILQTKLFIRNRKQLELTQKGMLFWSYAKRILTLMETSTKELQNASLYSRTIRFGLPNSHYECHVAEKLSSLLHKQDNAEDSYAIKITIDHSHHLLQLLSDGLLDGILSSYPENRKGYHCEHLFQDKLILVTHRKHTQFAKGIKQVELTQVPYLMCNFSLQDIGEYIRNLFPTHYQFQYEIDNSDKILPLLCKGIGYSFLPEQMAQARMEDGTLRQIPLLDFNTPKMDSYLIYKSKNAELLDPFLSIFK